MSYDFDVNTYSFDEILSLFNLSNGSEITEYDIKNAKIQLLKLHPDKSGLDSSYFLFYKKAFDIIVKKFRSQISVKVKTIVGCKDIEYLQFDDKNTEVITNSLKKMENKDFLEKFNHLYEDVMVDKEFQSSLKKKNEWFTSQQPLEILKTKKHNDLIQYKSIQSAYFGSGSNYFNDDEDDSYICCDPSSKLLFDDLRKVHLNESVINVEYNKDQIINNSSCEELRQQRIHQENRSMTVEEEHQYRRSYDEIEEKKTRILHLTEKDRIQTQTNSMKNSAILSHFMNISN